MTEGQELLERVEKWLGSFVVFPNEHMALTAALWAINTWTFDRFDATPYMAVTASTKQAGKTTLLELLSFLSQNFERIGAGTMAPTLYGLIESHDTKCALFFDEAERMSRGTATVMSGMMNSGYRRGETVPRRKSDGTIEKVRCYCPKLFALIGDPTETLRDRSILFVLKRAVGSRAYRPTTAVGEAAALVEGIKSILPTFKGKPIHCPDFLSNRDQEIWESLWSIAHWLGCDRATLARLKFAAEFLVAGKTAEIRRYTETADSEAAWEAAMLGERALLDLAASFKSGEAWITSAEAVRRLCLSGFWANYKGIGLDALRLGHLLSPSGVKPAVCGPKGKQFRAYTRKTVFASVPSKPLTR